MSHPLRRARGATLFTVITAFLLLACQRGQPTSPTPTPPPTAWPTLAPVGTVTPAIPSSTAAPPSQPRLIERYRALLEPGTTAVYPLEGHADQPIRIEVIVLEGTPDPLVAITDAQGDQLALADVGGPGEPEVIGQFQFPADGYYELNIATATVEGAVGVSLYSLDPATVEGGGIFSSLDEALRGRITHPLTYHTFRLPVERGQRFDLSATALTGTLDLLFKLYGPDGRLLAARDDNVGNDPYLWNFMPAQSGLYTVMLSNYGETTGDYLIRVSPSQGAGEAMIGIRTELELQGVPRRSTWLTLTGRALDGISVEVQPTSAGVDPTITLYDPYGNRLTTVDVAGPGEAERLTLAQFPWDGEYQLEFVTVAESGTVQYLIRHVSQYNLEVGGRIAPGFTGRKDVMEGPGTVYTYFFEGQAGELVSLDAHPTSSTSGLDLGIDLFTPDGYLLVSLDDVVGKNPVVDRLMLPQSGRYVLTVWNYGSAGGEFIVFVTLTQGAAHIEPQEGTAAASSGS